MTLYQISIEKYLTFLNDQPQKFSTNEKMAIVTDKNKLISYAENNCIHLGVVHENSYYYFIIDLIENSKGEMYTYSRVVFKNNYNGVVILPIFQSKIVLLRQFRHPSRLTEYALPRGFSEPKINSTVNAENEVFEELGAEVQKIDNLGRVSGDSGLNSGLVEVFVAETGPIKSLQSDEGIFEIKLVTLEEVKKMIESNEITDGFTICAIFKFLISEKARDYHVL
jgi:ADP-ribose pyrophosphatase